MSRGYKLLTGLDGCLYYIYVYCTYQVYPWTPFELHVRFEGLLTWNFERDHFGRIRSVEFATARTFLGI